MLIRFLIGSKKTQNISRIMYLKNPEKTYAVVKLFLTVSTVSFIAQNSFTVPSQFVDLVSLVMSQNYCSKDC